MSPKEYEPLSVYTILLGIFTVLIFAVYIGKLLWDEMHIDD